MIMGRTCSRTTRQQDNWTKMLSDWKPGCKEKEGSKLRGKMKKMTITPCTSPYYLRYFRERKYTHTWNYPIVLQAR